MATRNNLKDKIISIGELCETLSVSRQTIYNWQKAGFLKAHQLGGRKYFLVDELLNFLTNNPNTNESKDK